MKRRNFDRVRVLSFEGLEDRCLMAGGPVQGAYPVVPQNMVPREVQVQNLAVPQQNILPGQNEVSLARFTMATDAPRTYAQISQGTQFVLLPGYGDKLAGVVNSVSLKVDADNNPDNGCERQVALGYPDYASDLVIMDVSSTVWLRNNATTFEIVANFNSYLDASSVSVELAMVSGLKDLGGNALSDDIIAYDGETPTVHSIRSETFQISQSWNTKTFASVGESENWKLVEFSGWGTQDSKLSGISFEVTNPGNLVDASLSLVLDENWDKNGDKFYAGAMTPVDQDTSILNFNMEDNPAPGGNFWVSGLTAPHALPGDNTFKVEFTGQAQAVDKNGEPLTGVVVNGNGTGQIRVYTNQATTFALVEDPQLVVFSGYTGPNWENGVQPTYIDAGQEAVLSDFTAQNQTTDPIVINTLQLTAQMGSLTNFESYALWSVNDATGEKTRIGNGQLQLDNGGMRVEFSAGGYSVLPGVKAHLSATGVATSSGSGYRSVQARLDPLGFMSRGQYGSLGIDEVFYWIGQDPWNIIGGYDGRG